MTRALLQLAGVGVRRDGRALLDAVNLEIAAGEFVAVGLAVLLPCSFLAAGHVLPGPPRPPSNLLVCPNCGMAFPVWGIHTPTDAPAP